MALRAATPRVIDRRRSSSGTCGSGANWTKGERDELDVEPERCNEPDTDVEGPAPIEFPLDRRLNVDAGGPGIRTLPEGTSLMENELLMALATLDLFPPLPLELLLLLLLLPLRIPSAAS